MLEGLSKEIKVLSPKIEVKMSPDVSDTSKTTFSPNSSTNSTQSPIAPVSPNVLSAATPVEVANDDMKLHPSVRDFCKSDGTPKSSIIKSPKCFGQCNHIRVKPTPLRLPNRSEPVNEKSKQPEGIGLTKPVSLSNRTMSKVVAQNRSEAALPYHQGLTCS
ncbi:hypothetical protein ACTXT7_009960 [Hymenolepis weldensis]